MGKFGKRFLQRAIMNSKMGNKNYYKGRGARNEGNHTSKGGFVIRPERLMKIVAPDMSGFDLRPYVHTAVKPVPKGERVPVYSTHVVSNEAQMQ